MPTHISYQIKPIFQIMAGGDLVLENLFAYNFAKVADGDIQFVRI